MKRKMMKWVIMPVIAIVGFIGLSSFVEVSESSGGQVIVVSINTVNKIYNPGKILIEDHTVSEYSVSAGTIAIGGKTVPINISGKSTVKASYSTRLCVDCRWYHTNCSACTTCDDIMTVIVN